MSSKHPGEPGNLLSMLNDAVIVVLAFVSAMAIRLFFERHISSSLGARLGNWNSAPGAICLLLYVSAYLWTAQQYGLYSFRSPTSLSHQVFKTCQACLNACFVLSGAMFLAHAVGLSREVLVSLTLLASAALCGDRYLRSRRLRPARSAGPSSRNIAILGTNQLSFALSHQFQKSNQSPFNFVGFIEFPGSRFSPELSPASVIGDISNLRSIKAKCFLEAIVIAEFYPYDKTLDLLRTAHELDLDVLSIAGYYDELTTDPAIQYLGLFPASPLSSGRTLTQAGARYRGGSRRPAPCGFAHACHRSHDQVRRRRAHLLHCGSRRQMGKDLSMLQIQNHGRERGPVAAEPHSEE